MALVFAKFNYNGSNRCLEKVWNDNKKVITLILYITIVYCDLLGNVNDDQIKIIE